MQSIAWRAGRKHHRVNYTYTELSGKSLELLKEVIPGVSRVGVLAVAGPTVSGNALKEYEAAGRALKIPIQPLLVRSPNPDIEGGVSRGAQGTRDRFGSG